MHSYIVVSSREDFLGFVDQYCIDHKVPSYHIYVYDSRVKIADAREIKKILSLSSSLPRVFVFGAEVTIPAQNALLKSIEEASEEVSFLFNVQRVDDVLPTIHSRCTIVRLDKKKYSVELTIQRMFDEWLLRPNLFNSFSLSNYFSQKKNLEEFPALLSNVYWEALSMDNDSKKRLINVSRRYYTYEPLLEKNNLHEISFWDFLFLGSKLPLDRGV